MKEELTACPFCGSGVYDASKEYDFTKFNCGSRIDRGVFSPAPKCELTKLKSDVARLRKALEPFATLAQEIFTAQRGYKNCDDAAVSVAHLRNAARILDETNPAPSSQKPPTDKE